MKIRFNMNTLFISVACMMSAMFSSCEKPRKLPDNPDVPLIRYVTDQRMSSSIIGGTVLYSVYLPADYKENSDKRYPVVYLTHGLGDNHKSWNDQYLNVTSVISSMEQNDGLEPMIYVMPEGYRSYYANRYDGSYRYMDMFIEELVPYIDGSFRTIADRDHRAVVGYSMGGFGAFLLPSKNTDVFSVSVPLSMSFRTDEQYINEAEKYPDGWANQWGNIFGGSGQRGEAVLTDYYKAHCPYYMFTEETVSNYSGVSYFLDCGDDEEQLLVANDDLHVQMRDIEMPHEYRVRNGGHQSSYWRSGMYEVLPYIQNCFAGQTYKTEEVVDVPESYSAVREEKTLAGVPVEVFLPEGYSDNAEKEYPVVYLAHDGDEAFVSEDVMKILSSIQKQKPFIMVALISDDVEGVAFTDVVAAVDGDYRTLANSKNRVALGYGNGGAYLYNATADDSPISSLFLLDGVMDESSPMPNASMFYGIALGDMGVNYKGANALYKRCHSAGIPYEYRVYNGLPTRNSNLYGLSAIKPILTEKIVTK